MNGSPRMFHKIQGCGMICDCVSKKQSLFKYVGKFLGVKWISLLQDYSEPLAFEGSLGAYAEKERKICIVPQMSISTGPLAGEVATYLVSLILALICA